MMRPPRIAFEPRQQRPLPRGDSPRDESLGDLRFRALPDGWFSFTLDLVHPRFGALIRQAAVFREAGT